MALRMKDGLAEYKQGFSKRVALFAAVFVVGAVVGVYVLGHPSKLETEQDWYGKAASFHVSANSIERIDRTNFPEWLASIVDINILSSGHGSANAYLINFGSTVVVQLRSGSANQNLLGHFMRRSDRADLSDPVVGLRNGVASATWTKNGIEHLMIADVDLGTISEMAEQVSSR